MDLHIALPQDLVDAMSELAESPKWYESGAAIVVTSGLITILAGFVAHYLNQRSERLNRDAEHRNRRVEKMHDAQVDALKALCEINENLLPSVWPTPEYDSHEAYSEMLSRMPWLLNALDKFIKERSYILPEPIIHKLRDVIYFCNQGHWGETTAVDPEYDPSQREIRYAADSVRKLRSAILDLKHLVGVRINKDDSSHAIKVAGRALG